MQLSDLRFASGATLIACTWFWQVQVKADPYSNYVSPMVVDSDAERGYEAESSAGENEGGATRTARTARNADKRQPGTAAQLLPPLLADAPRKKYSQQFIWGQLNGWFKQTVYDPAATLSAERRGTLSLPDMESAYGAASTRYDAKVCFSSPIGAERIGVAPVFAFKPGLGG